MDMYKWIEDIKETKNKKAMPILSFPCVQLLEIGVKELIADSNLQAKGMKMVAERTNAAAAVSMMDLSVEAEAFGSNIRFFDDEVPAVIGAIVNTEDDAVQLKIPKIGDGRTKLYIDAISKAKKLITDRPILAGVIGPFSLAGRLMDVSEIMVHCYEEPEMVHSVLDKAAEFIIDYIHAYETAGADGVVIAEPLAGLLSPAMNEEFSVTYMKKIIDKVQSQNFIVIYHNCGNGTPYMVKEIVSMGAAAYHFGNAIDMVEMVEKFPKDEVIMGNIDPAGQFRNGTPESIRQETLQLLNVCGGYSNFVISSGCDIPPLSSWENIDSFFDAVSEYYNK